MRIESDNIYDHATHGTVVVLDVVRIYDSFDSETGEGKLEKVVVRYANEWDEYGPLESSVMASSVEEFVGFVGSRVGSVAFE